MKNISIIIPFYNSEKYIKDTIECIKKQTLDNIECILIDDGSTDNSKNIVNKLIKNDKRFIFKSQNNMGVSCARNYGKTFATGKYLLFLDSDDLFDSDMCEKMYNIAEKFKSDLVIFGIKIMDFSGKVKYYYNSGKIDVLPKENALKSFFIGDKFNVGVHTKLIRNDLASTLAFEEGKKINEDKYYLFQAISNSKKIIFADYCSYLYILHKGSASNSKYSIKYLDMIYFAEKIHKQCLSDYHSLIDYSYKNLAESYLQTYRKICGCNNKKYEKDKEEIYNRIKNFKLKNVRKCKMKNIIEILIIKRINIVYSFAMRFLYN